MPDISMCGNKTCPKRMDCYRYRAKPDPHRQSWANFSWEEPGGCGAFARVYPDLNEDRLTPEKDLQ